MKKVVSLIFGLAVIINCEAQLQRSNTIHYQSATPPPFIATPMKSFVPVEYTGSIDAERYMKDTVLTNNLLQIQSNFDALLENKDIIAQIEASNENKQNSIAVLINQIHTKENDLKARKQAVAVEDKKLKAIKNNDDSIGLSARITEDNNHIKNLQADIIELRKELTALNESIRDNLLHSDQLRSQNLQLTGITDNLKRELLGRDRQIEDLLKTKRDYILLRYQTDSTTLNSFLGEVEKNVNETKTILDSNKAILDNAKKAHIASKADSANFNDGWNDIAKLYTITGEAGVLLKHTLDTFITQSKQSQKDFNDLTKLFEHEKKLTIIYLDSLIVKRKIEFLASKKTIEAKQKAFVLEFEKYKTNFQTNNLKLQNILAQKKETAPEDDVSVLGNFVNPLNESGLLIPGFEVLAYKKFRDDTKSYFGQAKFILGNIKSDTNNLNNATRLFVPEASNLGFMVDFTFGFDKATYISKKDKELTPYHSLGINFGLYYLQKQLITMDKEKTPFTIGLIQTKAGFEKTIVRNGLAAFVNLNGIYVGRGMESYEKHYDDSNKMQWYVDLGLKSYLTLTKDTKTNLLMELRFIPVNDFIRKTTGTADSFIPLIKIGFSKNFAF